MAAARDSSTRGHLVVICGLPGAGKTTLARHLAETLDAVRMCPDEWLDELQLSLRDEAARARVEALQWNLTRQILRGGSTVIIEWGTWTRAERDRLRDGARALGATVELRFVDAPIDVLHQRVSGRANAEKLVITREELEAWDALFERPTTDEHATYDTIA